MSIKVVIIIKRTTYDEYYGFYDLYNFSANPTNITGVDQTKPNTHTYVSHVTCEADQISDISVKIKRKFSSHEMTEEASVTVSCPPGKRLAQLGAELLLDFSLTDIDLIAHGKVPFSVHRLILCAGSQVFKDMLMRRSQEKVITTITLEHIHAEELQSILEFLYLGETTVSLDKLPDLIKAARSLEIMDFHVGEDQNPQETVEEFQGGQSDRKTETGLRAEEDGKPPTSSSKAGKRKRSSSQEETPEPSSSSTTTPVISRSQWRKNKEETKEDNSVKNIKASSPKAEGSPPTPATPNSSGKKPLGTCPICFKSMKFSVLERHAGEAVTDCCWSSLTFIFFQLIVRGRPSPGGQSPVSTNQNMKSLIRLVNVGRF